MAARNQLLNLLETDFLSRTARKTVLRYVSKKAIPMRELEDVEMSIIEKFINQKQQIVANFEGKAQPATYCTAILNRMCCEVIRKEWKHWQAVENEVAVIASDYKQVSDSQTDHNLLIVLELERLQFALKSLHQSAPSAEILLMFHFELQPAANILEEWAGAENRQVKSQLEKLADSNKTARYQIIASMLSVVEAKKIKPDALRMRIYKYMDMLIERLNRNDQSQHTRETLKLLFEIRVQHSESNTKPSAVERFRFDKTVLLIILLNSLPWIF